MAKVKVHYVSKNISDKADWAGTGSGQLTWDRQSDGYAFELCVCNKSGKAEGDVTFVLTPKQLCMIFQDIVQLDKMAKEKP